MLELVSSLLAEKSVQNAQATFDQPVETIAVTQQKTTLPAVHSVPAIAIPESISVPLISASPTPIQVPVQVTPVQVTPVAATSEPQRAVIKQSSIKQNSVPKPSSSQVSSQAVGTQTLSAPPREIVVSAPTASQIPTATRTSKVQDSSTAVIESETVLSPKQQDADVSSSGRAVSQKSVQTVTRLDQQKNHQEQAIQLKPVQSSISSATVPANSTIGSEQSQGIGQQRKLLEQRLADIVAKDRAAKTAKLQETIVARAYQYAAERRFEQAKQVLQDPAVSPELRSETLTAIRSMQSSNPPSKTSLFSKTSLPSKPTKAALTPATVKQRQLEQVKTKSRTAQALPKAPVIIQVPVAVQPADRVAIVVQARTLPQTAVKSSQFASASDKMPRSSDGEFTVVNPTSTPLAYNPNLPGSGSTNSDTTMVYPLPAPVPVTSGYGWRTHPVTRVKRFHSGIDLGAAYGTPILAARGGRVTVADRMGGYGLAIVVEQQNGKQDTLYGHLSEIFVRPGERVQPGAVIGRVGSTGVSTGPHLHYEARQQGNSGWVTVNPAAQLESAKIRLMRANS
jgi:murein DD-endopeptidase MepM/ murein hydrolase activator NlpD